MNKKQTIVISAAFLLVTLAVGIVAANPISPPLITVTSPQNNQVYPQNSIWLNFTALPMATKDFNFSSFTYSLDGQAQVGTNGSTLLTNLPSGSHTLAIYGKAGYGYWMDHDMLLDVLYFSTTYSTSWVTFTVAFLATSVPLSVGLFVNRRPIAGRLKGKKTGSFWAGVTCFLFFAIFVFGPSLWQLTNKYLFPQYGHGAVEISPQIYMVPGVIIGLIFMVIGFFLMIMGTRQHAPKT